MTEGIGAVVMAAGLSRRMGQPKLVLPWGKHTVIEQVITSLQEGGAEEIVVVTGGAREAVEAVLKNYAVRLVHNPEHAQREMLTSLQLGLAGLGPDLTASLVCLGDQPQIESWVVRDVIRAYQESGSRLVVPSYEMKRGHPWLVERSLWQELLTLGADATLRDFLNRQASNIYYQVVDSASILKDLDTPEEYQAQKPDEN